jgi:response regulator RpfG family c-di-GMP phosphodiesterase
VYDALTTRRVYKAPMPHEKAASIISEGRGTHFDPAIVDAFFSIENTFLEIARRYDDVEPA